MAQHKVVLRQARHLLSKCKKNAATTEQYGVVACVVTVRNHEAPALPRSNQIDATLFDKGQNDTYGDQP